MDSSQRISRPSKNAVKNRKRPRKAYVQVVCKHCNSFAVYWQTVQRKEVLYCLDTLTPHVCDPQAVETNVMNQFKGL